MLTMLTRSIRKRSAGQNRQRYVPVLLIVLVATTLGFAYVYLQAARGQQWREMADLVQHREPHRDPRLRRFLRPQEAQVALGALLQQGADPNVLPPTWQVVWDTAWRESLARPRYWPGLTKSALDGELRSYPVLCLARTEAMARILIAHGADVNAGGGKDRETPLMCAAMGGHAAVVRVLVAAGAPVNQRSRSGLTALHYATRDMKSRVSAGAEGDYAQVLRILLDSGADVVAPLPDGTTPLMHAERSRHARLVGLLKEAAARRQANR